MSLSEPDRGQIVLGPASEICEAGHIGCHAALVLLEPKDVLLNASLASIPKTIIVAQDDALEAMVRFLLKQCREQSAGQKVFVKTIHHILSRIIESQKLAMGEPVCSPAVNRVASYLRNNFREPLEREFLSCEVGVSEGHLSRIFRREMGKSMGEYLLQMRLEHACLLLWEQDNSAIRKIWTACGFESEAHFYICFRKAFGMTPGEYRSVRPFSMSQLR